MDEEMQRLLPFLNGADPSVAKRVVEFHSKTVRHAFLDAAKARLEMEVKCSPAVEVIAVVGPTGVGKTTLKRLVLRSMADLMRAQMERDASMIPFISTVAVAHSDKKFDFRRLYVDGLVALRDQFVGCRQPSKQDREEAKRRVFSAAGETESTAAVRLALERAAQRRRCGLWSIDEADHVVMGLGEDVSVNQLHVVKSIGQTTRMKLVLIGTHTMAEGLIRSGQLCRRSGVIYLENYRWGVPSELTEFGRVFNGLLCMLKMEEFPSVRENLHFFYLGSLGCIGLAKDWVTKAYGWALEQGKAAISLEDFEATRKSSTELRVMAAEIQAFRAFLAESRDDTELKALMGMSTMAAETPGERKRAMGRGNLKPGKRRPTRDPVATLADLGGAAT